MRVAREVRRLRSMPGPATTLAAAYELYLDGNLSGDYGPIEDLRSRLENSEDILTFQDLGSGPSRGLYGPGTANVSRPLSQIMKSSAPEHECRLIAALIQQFQPGVAIELGTCLGISAAYQVATMEATNSGFLYTIEGGRALADFSRSNLDALGLGQVEVINAPFSDALPDILHRVSHVEFAFIDGHHDGDATVQYFKALEPKLASGSVVVFDDLSWSPSMRKAWKTIINDPRIACSSDLFAIGICIVS